MWTEAETQCLIDGVARFGIGSWKKILNHPEYNFQRGRNAIDLKDRFRTCFPAVYSDSAQQQEEPAEGTSPDRRAKAASTTVELTKMGATEAVKFPKLDRRRRKHFTQDEDERLLRGFIKYGSQWKAIHMDPELGLQHRTRTDLRDRFRNRYPQRFTEAGFQHKAKQPPPPQQQQQPAPPLAPDRTSAPAPPPAANPWTPMDELVSNLVVNPGSTLEPAPSGAHDVPHPMRLLTASFDPFAAFDDFSGSVPDDPSGGGGSVQLSRTIIDWADQNTARQQLGGVAQGLEAMPMSIVAVPAEIPPGAMDFPAAQAAVVHFGGPSTAPLSQILNSRGSFAAHFPG
jgi:Myb-like DNA-binding domain